MKRVVYFWMLVLLATSPAMGSQLVDYQFPAPSMGGALVPVRVYLPTGYDPAGPPYRLYVFLHGCCGLNHTSHSGVMKPALDAKIDSGQIEPMIVAWPAGIGSDLSNRHMWTDSERNGNYESLVVVDLLHWLTDSGFNVSPAREQRALGGFSMGGDGAIRMAIRNSDRFIAFVSHSGGPAVQWFRTRFPLVVGECPESEPPYTYDPGNGFWTDVFFGIASAFSPNMDNPPWNQDFPVLPDGNEDESAFTGDWVANHDPATLIQDSGIYTHDVSMYFEVGTSDPWMYESNVLLDQELGFLGVPHTFRTFAGGHVLMSSRVEATLDWLDEVMDGASAGVPEVNGAGGAHGLELGQDSSNPAQAEARFWFRLGAPALVRFDVFDVAGKRVATLVDGVRSAGVHRVALSASELASGVYLCRLSTPDGVLGRRFVVVN